MNIDQERALRKLTALHGRTIVNRYLPMVAKNGFTYICEISHGDTVREVTRNGWTGLEIENNSKSWNPMFSFHNKELWETAAGYRVPSPSPIRVIHSSNPGECHFEDGESVGKFLAHMITRKAYGKYYGGRGYGHAPKTADQLFWEDFAEKEGPVDFSTPEGQVLVRVQKIALDKGYDIVSNKGLCKLAVVIAGKYPNPGALNKAFHKVAEKYAKDE